MTVVLTVHNFLQGQSGMILTVTSLMVVVANAVVSSLQKVSLDPRRIIGCSSPTYQVLCDKFRHSSGASLWLRHATCREFFGESIEDAGPAFGARCAEICPSIVLSAFLTLLSLFLCTSPLFEHIEHFSICGFGVLGGRSDAALNICIRGAAHWPRGRAEPRPIPSQQHSDP